MSSTETTNEYLNISLQNQKALLKDLSDLISIASVNDPDTADVNHPFGMGIDQALDLVASWGRRDGFKVGEIDNRVVYIEYGNPNADVQHTVAILAHIDVVPVGPGWKTDPFTLVEDDGQLYGRGVQDMKGDLVSSYYALKQLKDSKITLPNNIKIHLIIGSNEEGAWDDLPVYFKHFGTPEIGFSPDGKFPVVNAEKGFVTYKIKFKNLQQFGSNQLIELDAGNADNMVPGTAAALIKTTNPETIAKEFTSFINHNKKIRGQFAINGSQVHLSLTARSAHGAYPQLGKNAATYLAHFLTKIDLDDYPKSIMSFFGKTLHRDPYATKIDLAFEDNIMGKLTMNIGQVHFNNHEWYATINFRYPKGIQETQIKNKLQQHLASIGGIIESTVRLFKPHFVDSNDPVVTSLSNIYAEQTGEYLPPFTASGGSYASLLPRGVAFGGQFPDTPTTSHAINETIIKNNLFKSQAIFIESIIALSNITSKL